MAGRLLILESMTLNIYVLGTSLASVGLTLVMYGLFAGSQSSLVLPGMFLVCAGCAMGQTAEARFK
jgi:hypothetical protein